MHGVFRFLSRTNQAARFSLIAVALAVVAVALIFHMPSSSSSSPILERHHIIVTANPYASEAGREILRQGGSAVDAAIAAQMVLTVVEPQSSGIGGGVYLLVSDAHGQMRAYDGRETARLKPHLHLCFSTPEIDPSPTMRRRKEVPWPECLVR